MTSYVDKPSIADAQTGARVFILSCKHAGMVSLSYFEKQILTLQPYNRESFLFIFYLLLVNNLSLLPHSDGW